MTLLTTLRARQGSGLEALTERGWDLDHAVQTLTDIAQNDDSTGTRADREAFLSLAPDERRAMLSNVTLADSAPPSVGIRAALERFLVGTHESRFLSPMADMVEGWWWRRALFALKDKTPIHASELRGVIDEARRALSDRGLPIRTLDEFEDTDLPTVALEEARFLACLHAINAGAGIVDAAIDDFFQASAHRSYWLRRLLVGPEELARYDVGLSTEWDLRCERAFEDLDDQSGVDDRAKAGRKLYLELQLDVQRPLRAEVPDLFVQRGSLHALAERERLAWHPDAAESIRARSKASDAR